MTTLGERLKFLLIERNVTQAELAEMVGTTQGAISNIVKGETQKPRNILEIANALGVDPNWLKYGSTKMTKLSERLKALLVEKGINQTEFANMIGIAQPSMQKILAGETRNPRKIVEIAKELGTTPDYLLYGDMTVSHSTLENSQINNNQGQTVNNFFDSGSDELREMLHKQQISLKTKPTEEWVFALDVNRLAETDIINVHFPRPFEALHLSQDGMMDLLKLRSTANVAMITMFNESMSPVINKKDLMFVDTTCKQYAGEGIYLCVMNNELYVRRLYQTPSGVLNAVAENERVGSSFEIDDLSRLNVLGRCVRKFSIVAEDL